MKTISLLYKDSAKREKLGGRVLSDAVYNLNIDRMVYAACKNTQCADYLLSVIESAPIDKECAVYRSGILKDFLKNPKLLSSSSFSIEPRRSRSSANLRPP